MEIKAAAFDIGNTLVRYNCPLNWKSLYVPALRQAMASCRINPTVERVKNAETILMKYNTRENPREQEVSADTIFKEILDAWKLPYDRLSKAKEAFYGFFQTDAVCYGDAEETLKHLRSAGIKTGALTDVAYGMDNALSLQDIAPIRRYFDLVLTSVDVGFRKPNKAGFLALLRALDVSPSQMVYVGDEEKDIVGANSLGIVSILISRNDDDPDWGQAHTVHCLSEIRDLPIFMR